MTSLVYLYAVLSERANAAIPALDGAQVRWIESGGLAAAVSDVPAAEFEEEPLNANVRDMAWLGPRAIAHQDVNARLFESSDAVVPLAFGTVFRDDDRVRQLLAEHASKLSEQLERVRGCAEWVVALHMVREPDPADVAASSKEVQALRKELAASSPGRAHLLRRQLAALERDEARRIHANVATEILDALGSTTVQVFREPLPSDAVERPLLRASLLVRRNAEAAFLEQVECLRERWPEPTYRLLLTGPWPAYRFAGLDRDAV